MRIRSILLAMLAHLHIRKSQQFPSDISLSTKNNTFYEECLISVIVQSDSQNVHLICGSNSSFCPTYIVNHAPGIAWTFFDKEIDVELADAKKDMCIMSAEDVPTMFIMLHRLPQCHRANIIFAFQRMHVRRDALKELFDEAWNLGIIDVVIVTTDIFFCRVFTYIPFSDGLCFNTSPILLYSCQRESTCLRNNSLTYFPENKISNLHYCQLIVEYDKLDQILFKSSSDLNGFLMAAMNATSKSLSQVRYGFPEKRDNSSNVLIGRFYATAKRFKSFVFPSYLEKTSTALAVPEQPVSNIEWFRLFNELSVSVWYGIGISFAVTVVALYILMKREKEFGYVILFALRPLFGIPSPTTSLSLQAKLCFMGWLLLSLNMNAMYLTTLLRKLTVNFKEETIKTMWDFLQSDLVLHFTTEYAEYAFTIMSVNTEFYDFARKIKFFNKSYIDLIERNRSDIAYLIAREDFDLLFSNMSYRVLDEDIFVSTGATVMLPRPSPYERFFKLAVLRMFEVGAFVFVEKRNLRNKSFWLSRRLSKTGAEPLSMRSLAPVFVLWFMGCFVAASVLIIEKLKAKVKRKCPPVKKNSKIQDAATRTDKRFPKTVVHVESYPVISSSKPRQTDLTALNGYLWIDEYQNGSRFNPDWVQNISQVRPAWSTPKKMEKLSS